MTAASGLTPCIHCIAFVLQDSRTQKLATLSELKAKVSETEAKLAQYAGSDPEKVKELGEGLLLL